MAKAHGDAATSTTRARSVQVHGSPTMNPNNHQDRHDQHHGTSGRAIRSTSAPVPPCGRGPARPAPRSESASYPGHPRWPRPAGVAEPFTDPAGTSSPDPPPPGSTLQSLPMSITRSARHHDLGPQPRSPAPTTRMSSTITAGTVTSPPSREIRAVCGISASSPRRPSFTIHRPVLKSLGQREQEGQRGRLPDMSQKNRPDRRDRRPAGLRRSRPRASRRRAPGTKV